MRSVVSSISGGLMAFHRSDAERLSGGNLPRCGGNLPRSWVRVSVGAEEILRHAARIWKKAHVTTPTSTTPVSTTPISTTVNGESRTVEIAGHESAVDIIREQLGLTGTKLVCAGGVCGACTVQIDGTPVAGCLTPATAMRDAEVTTVEGLGRQGRPPSSSTSLYGTRRTAVRLLHTLAS